MRKLELLCLVGILALVAPSSAQGAQDGRVITDEAAVLEGPSESAAVLIRLHRGQLIRMSSRSRDGFFHVQLPEPIAGADTGWMSSRDVQPDTLSRELRAAGISLLDLPVRESGDHRWLLYAYHHSQVVNPGAIQAASGLTGKSVIGSSLGGELGYRFSPSWTLLAHLNLHSFERSGTVGGVTASYAIKGTFGALLLEQTFIHSLPWKTSFALGAGASFGTTVTIGKAVSDALTMPAGIAKIAVRWYPWERFAVVADAGYRYFFPAGVRHSGADVAVEISSLFAGGGIQVEF